MQYLITSPDGSIDTDSSWNMRVLASGILFSVEKRRSLMPGDMDDGWAAEILRRHGYKVVDRWAEMDAY